MSPKNHSPESRFTAESFMNELTKVRRFQNFLKNLSKTVPFSLMLQTWNLIYNFNRKDRKKKFFLVSILTSVGNLSDKGLYKGL